MTAPEVGGVAHFLQPGFAHFEETDLVRGAMAVLDATQCADRHVAVPLELQNHVHRVLQRARPGEAAFLGDLPDEDDGRAAAPRDGNQQFRRSAHLRRATRRCVEVGAAHRLHAVHDADHRSALVDEGRDLRDIGRVDDAHLAAVCTDTPRAARYLRGGFLAADVERLFAGVSGDREHQGGFADARFAAHDDDAPRDRAAAQHAIEFVAAGGAARGFRAVEARQRHRCNRVTTTERA